MLFFFLYQTIESSSKWLKEPFLQDIWLIVYIRTIENIDRYFERKLHDYKDTILESDKYSADNEIDKPSSDR